MKFMAIGHVHASPEQLGSHMGKEPAATLKLYVEGIVEQFWFVEKAGPVFLMNVASAEAARAALATLPLVTAGLIDYDLLPLAPLVPLGRLIPAA
jgi:hypothetical protein